VKQQQYEQQEVQLKISTVFKGVGGEQPKGKEKKHKKKNNNLDPMIGP